MSTNSIEVAKPKEFSIFDKLDEDQIIKADKAVKQKMVYANKQGNKEITYTGLKHIVLEMATKGNPLEVIESTCTLDKDDPDDKESWRWRSKVTVKSKKYDHESTGFSECEYLERIKEFEEQNGKKVFKGWKIGNYDPFGRTKALSKAERNAWRKQIPELVIVEMLKMATEEQTQKIDNGKTLDNQRNKNKICDCGSSAVISKDSRICLKCGGREG